MHFPTDDLARRVTEFQIGEGPDGKIVGALGLQMLEKQGRIHSEAFTDFALADQLRPLLWDRLHSVAINNGLLRVWTQEQAPFWNHCGLVKADADTSAKLPAAWRGLGSEWLTLKLRDELSDVISLDKEFALFMESEKQRTARTMQHAKILKLVATLIALVVLGLVVLGAFLLLRKNPHLLNR
jgi:hypothetical protein